MASKIRQLQTDITASGQVSLSDVSGVANTLDALLSGTLVTQINNTSGTLNTTINNVSGALAAQIGTGGTGGSNYSVALLTGLGQNFSGWYTLSIANLGNNHPVNGVTGVVISPNVSGIVDATLSVNGLIYNLDNYVNASGTTLPGVYGSINASGGFSLDITGPKIKWNYNSSTFSGFELTNTDNIILRYQE